MNCNKLRKGAKEFYEMHEDEYLPARNEEFKEYAIDIVDDLLDQYLDNVDEDTIPQFMDFIYWLEIQDIAIADNFSFETKDQWIGSEFESALGDCADAAYEEYKDRQMGL